MRSICNGKFFLISNLMEFECQFGCIFLVVVDFVMAVFHVKYCRNTHDIAPHGVTAAEALISLSAVVQEGSPED